MHPGMVIDASRDGDRSIPGWQSMHRGMHRGLAMDAPGMAITASLVSNQRRRSIHPGSATGASGMAIDAPGKTIAASLDGDHYFHPGIELEASRDGNRRDEIPGKVIRHPGMAIDAYLDHVIPIAASRDGDRCTGCGNYSMPGWRSMHPGMEIKASRNGDPCIRGWRSIHHGMASQQPWMAIDASPDGGHQSRVAIIASRDGDL